MAKRPSPSQNYHFECTYNNISREELKLFITHLPPMCERDSLFDVIIQGGMDEDTDNVQFDFNAKWYGITHEKLKTLIDALTCDTYNISIIACEQCSERKKQRIDIDFSKVVFPPPADLKVPSNPPNPPLPPFQFIRFVRPSSRANDNLGVPATTTSTTNPGVYDAFGPLAEHELMKFVREKQEKEEKDKESSEDDVEDSF